MSKGDFVFVAAFVLSLALIPHRDCAAEAQASVAAAASQQIVMDDFETEPKDWKFIGGQEFPGAKGVLTRDTDIAHGSKASYRLEADFNGGGRYVGTWKNLAALNLSRLQELRIWIKSANVTRIGVRIVDGSDQCHQKKNIPLKSGDDWQEVVLKVQDLVGEEHWGGANDGKWHGTVKGFGINIGKDGIANSARPRGALWLDDIRAVVTPP